MPAALTSAGSVCASCDYSLDGLGPRGRCPECGSWFWLSLPEPPPGIGRRFWFARKKLIEAVRSRIPTFRSVAISLLILGAGTIVICIAVAAYSDFVRRLYHP